MQRKLKRPKKSEVTFNGKEGTRREEAGITVVC